MQIIKKSSDDIKIENSHGTSGYRRPLMAAGEIEHLQGITNVFLPAGSKFDFHSHDFNEIMIVLKGGGHVYDKDGEYTYNTGDVFIYPAGIEHAIENISTEKHEFIFVKVKTC